MRRIILLLLLTCVSSLIFAAPSTLSPIIGPSTVCTGLTIRLTATPYGGTWSNSNPSVATIAASPSLDSELVTGLIPGTTTISYTVAGLGTVTTVITVNPSPAAIISSTVSCHGTSVTFSDATPGGMWSSSNSGVATVGASTGIVLSITGGSTAISYTYGSCSAVSYINVPPYCPCSGTPIPGTATANNSSVCPGDSILLSLSGDSMASNLSFQWQSSPDAITWTNIVGATNLPYTHYTDSASYYRTEVTCSISGLFAYSTAVLVGISSGNIIASHTVVNSPSYSCTNLDFYTEVCGFSSAYNLTTYFGDGTSGNATFSPYVGNSYADVYHAYAFPGTYFVKQVFYNGLTPVDSVSFPYEYSYCSTLPVKFFLDANNNCTKDPDERYNNIPLMIEVDSNNIPIDAISGTGGIYYQATGAPGTIYAFKLLPSGIYISCPASGIIYDTIQEYVNIYPVKYASLNCTNSIQFDLAVYDVIPVTGEHDEWGNIYVFNKFCTPVDASVTLHYSPKYNVNMGGGALDVHPTPSSYTSSSITWNVGGLSADTGPVDLYYAIWTNLVGGLLTPGDTVNSYVTITPTVGDVNPDNNYDVIVDTIKAGCDPNEMSVSPAGYIPSGTQLQYTLNFDNVGNDTAYNIYAMDTLSDNVDPKTLRIVSTSAAMNIAILNYGGHNIVKFDFPNINLLDSSHHSQCSGNVIFNIKVRDDLPEGTTIYNHAGVFFDYNAVVTTDTVENIIGWPAQVASIANTQKVTISPNPTTSNLNIAMSPNAYTTFSITNSIGQQIMQQTLTSTQTNVNVSTLSPGLYYITFRGDNGTKVQKFVKM